jgi:ATP-dependent Lon protease
MDYDSLTESKGTIADAQGENLTEETAKLDGELAILPTKGTVVFPYLIMPLMITDPRYARLIDEALMQGKSIGLFAQRNLEVETPGPEDLYKVGAAGTIMKMLRFPDGSVRFLVQGLSRVCWKRIKSTDPYITAEVDFLEPRKETGVETEALVRSVLELLKKIVQLAPYLPEDLQVSALNTDDPSKLADLIASNLNISVAQKQEILETIEIKERLHKLIHFIGKEVEVLEMSKKIQSQAASEMGKSQREYILREQLKAIQRELGEGDDRTLELDEFRKKIEAAGMSEEALEAANKELDRLSRMNPSAAEYIVSRTYLDWLVNLPWSKSSEDKLDIREAEKILDEDHYDLDRVKERILEFLAVRKLKSDLKGPILCFVGPPGVGKTSLGRSIARAMGRQFHRISLGGVRDEAEIRGHRRTYIGSLPGRVIQGLRKVGANNPVFMLDEMDKIGADFRGDPSSALLEVLDPEQNHTFSDHYLDVTFDLSKVLFIGTANILETIPPVLRDRMEVIELPGYTDMEKLAIAKRFLIPRELENHGLRSSQLGFSDSAVKKIIHSYTRESGLRNLNREIAAICRKVAKKVAIDEKVRVSIVPESLAQYLGAERFLQEVASKRPQVGVIPGLAWTSVGGEILFVEATKMPGKRSLTLTGHMGEVMKESVQAALSYIRSTAANWGIPDDTFERYDIHVHVPAGATPKDGPSAGITMATAIASVLTERPVKRALAMTGEITLRGEVLPIGGVKEKALAAYRAGIRTVLIPKHNVKDLEEVPKEIKRKVEFVPVETVEEVLKLALDRPKRKESKKASGRKARR